MMHRIGLSKILRALEFSDTHVYVYTHTHTGNISQMCDAETKWIELVPEI